RHMIVQTVGDQWFQLEEIRLRLNTPIEFIFTHDVIWLEEIVVSEQIGQYLLNKITDHSLYRMDTELKEGFITIKGGHRVGLAGEVITLEDQVDHIQYVTFFNIRIAKQHTGIASPLLKYLHHENTYYNTLIIGPPQTGKTSLIRDLA